MDGMALRAAEADAVPPELAEHAAVVDRTGALPWDSLDALHAEGLPALTARAADGGQDAGLARVADLVRRAGQGCASTALILAMQLTHLRTAARSDWPEHLRALVGRGAGRFGALINALRVEPALGTPARGGLVGTPQQVGKAFPDHHALGVNTFLIRGFDLLGDVLEYGRTLLTARTPHQTAAE